METSQMGSGRATIITARWGTYGGSPAFAWGQALILGGDRSATYNQAIPVPRKLGLECSGFCCCETIILFVKCDGDDSKAPKISCKRLISAVIRKTHCSFDAKRVKPWTKQLPRHRDGSFDVVACEGAIDRRAGA